MIDREHDFPITKQAKALNISRGSVYYLPRPVSAADLAIMRRIDELHLEFPFAGSRKLRGLLVAEGCRIGRRHVKTLDPPSMKWSDLKYVIWHQGGPICRGRGTSLRRLSRSCGRLTFWSRKARALLTRSARLV